MEPESNQTSMTAGTLFKTPEHLGQGKVISSTYGRCRSLSFFGSSLKETDKEIFSAIEGELSRQQNQIELIASENIVSRAVLDAQGSVLTNKYAEGYPGKRYYGGCEFADKVESAAIERAKKLYNTKYANVQPNSGSQANQGIFGGVS